VEDDTGISRDGHSTWTIAMLHTMEMLEFSGVSLGAFWLTAPFGVSFFSLLKEFLGDLINVVVLISHLL